MKLKTKLIALLILVPLAASAFQCGSFNVHLDHYQSSINGDLVKVLGQQFTGAPRDCDNSIITLLPDSITVTDRMYKLTTTAGHSTLELLTKENTPRTLNRERCGKVSITGLME
ncbi:hypothetical protein [Rosenbergiella epipactidis]|uniref:hypothetical protein n=1 Tax=Rosenbergiella epipactidis TaxID=1544694 RepID=UPI001F4E3ECF|nr:hypothetical protein [Rosenbergiella epipactidis]